jgi:hypothetical protein
MGKWHKNELRMGNQKRTDFLLDAGIEPRNKMKAFH